MTLDELARSLKENTPMVFTQTAEANPVLYQKFLEHQCQYTRKNNPVTGASGGATTYEFTPTDIGTIIKVRCACGRRENITDCSGW